MRARSRSIGRVAILRYDALEATLSPMDLLLQVPGRMIAARAHQPGPHIVGRCNSDANPKAPRERDSRWCFLKRSRNLSSIFLESCRSIACERVQCSPSLHSISTILRTVDGRFARLGGSEMLHRRISAAVRRAHPGHGHARACRRRRLIGSGHDLLRRCAPGALQRLRTVDRVQWDIQTAR